MTSTRFWEIAGFVLSLVQMILYINGFKKYRKRLSKLATALRDRADTRFDQYSELRDRDKEFFDFYNDVQPYSVCVNDMARGKGAPFAAYGNKLRSSFRTIRGFSQMQRVTATHALAHTAVQQAALHRAVNYIQEVRRVDEHYLARWQAIVTAPVVAGTSDNLRTVIDSSFSTLTAFGRGFNSAGVALGRSIYGFGDND